MILLQQILSIMNGWGVAATFEMDVRLPFFTLCRISSKKRLSFCIII